MAIREVSLFYDKALCKHPTFLQAILDENHVKGDNETMDKYTDRIKTPSTTKPKTSGVKRKNKRYTGRKKPPSHIVFVPDIENPNKLTKVGVMFRFQSGKYKGTGYSLCIDDDPRAKQLAYENFERLVILPDRS